jgi:hypothetical protein
MVRVKVILTYVDSTKLRFGQCGLMWFSVIFLGDLKKE